MSRLCINAGHCLPLSTFSHQTTSS
ncbi:hypothetical protein CCACVL1_01184, partial [Corchorus capsularis]